MLSYSRHTTNSFEATITTEAGLLLQNKVAKTGYYAYSTYSDCDTIPLPAPILGLKLGLFAPTKTHTVCLLIRVIS